MQPTYDGEIWIEDKPKRDHPPPPRRGTLCLTLAAIGGMLISGLAIIIGVFFGIRDPSPQPPPTTEPSIYLRQTEIAIALTQTAVANESRRDELFETTIDFVPLQSSPRAAERLATYTDWIISVDYSDTGDALAAGSADGTLWLWTVTGVDQVFAAHQQDVFAVAFHPVGDRLASASWDAIRVWSVPEVTQLSTLPAPDGGILSLAFHPDGERLAAGGNDGFIYIYDLTTQQVVAQLEGHTRAVQDVAFSPDGSRLASASRDETARLWDSADWTLAAVLEGHQDRVSGVAFSPAGRWLATSGGDESVRVWDATRYTLRYVLWGHTDYVRDVAFSPDGTLLASAGEDGVVRVWDVVTGAERNVLPGHDGLVLALDFRPGAAHYELASVSTDGDTAALASALNEKECDSAKHCRYVNSHTADDGRGAMQWRDRVAGG